MSNFWNDQLFDLAREHMEYWGDGYWFDLLDKDLDTGDYEALSEHIKQSAREMMYVERLEV